MKYVTAGMQHHRKVPRGVPEGEAGGECCPRRGGGEGAGCGWELKKG